LRNNMTLASSRERESYFNYSPWRVERKIHLPLPTGQDVASWAARFSDPIRFWFSDDFPQC